MYLSFITLHGLEPGVDSGHSPGASSETGPASSGRPCGL